MFQSFWSLGTGWGRVKIDPTQTEISVIQGELHLKEIRLPYIKKDTLEITLESRPIDFEKVNGIIKFKKEIEINPNNPLVISLS